MLLQRQVQILSVDTGNFYSNNEVRLHKLNHKLKYERRVLKDRLADINKKLNKLGITDKDIEEYHIHGVLCDSASEKDSEIIELLSKFSHYNDLYSYKTAQIKQSKVNLQEKLKQKTEQNIQSNGKNYIRILREDTGVSKARTISVFDSSFTRTIGAKPNEFTEDFMVIQVYYFSIAEDIIRNGFIYKGEKYIYFTSSAGQIRQKKMVFIKENIWNKYERTLMCGLSLDAINDKGGCNINKFLAYLALNNSASNVWQNFDIDKVIVIDDFETNVLGTYDFVDDKDYSITRKTDYVPIPHTDGCGMILPNAFGETQRNRMIRCSWIKGLLGVFDFKQFIIENDCLPVIKDIYGMEHDIIAEDIQVILTKSQFKMYKYYNSWQQYKDNFKKYNCTANFANIEEERIKNAKINYQMLQTLTDVTDSEIRKIAQPSIDKLNSICDSIDNVKKIFGVTPYNLDKTPLQQSIELYPELINDAFLKEKLRQARDSLVKKYKSGKLEVQGKYTFILPDLYAACEYWFMGISNPKGLLNDGEVFCWLFQKADEVDCLRSPHLYIEHAIRKNLACENNRQQEIRKWFCTNALYTSCKDMISKILMFDVDGDCSLVVIDKKIIEVAKRNIEKYNVVPLFYNMRKAAPSVLSSETIYNGLCAAFSGSNIGQYSNNITKIWNSNAFVNGDMNTKLQAIDFVKISCMESNETIDFAKTLYRSTPPKHIAKDMKEFTKLKVPHFFVYAKDKTQEQVAEKNESFVNKLDDIIVMPKLNLTKLHIKKPDYRLLMNNPDIDVEVEFDDKGRLIKEKTSPVIVRHSELNKEYFFNLDNILNPVPYYDVLSKANERTLFIYHNLIQMVKTELSKYGNTDTEIADILIKYLYSIKNSKRKNTLWLCYGDIIIENLKKHKELRVKEVQCIDCGEWLSVGIMNTKTCRCDYCQKNYIRWYDRQRKKQKRTSV